ncbi:hypothetical protein AAF712_015349 [Marasmius tenuissimus]|uniref:Uncharacterized protein n=1 Tax=Marasmius tenuissimus TaxID=585030 RepID=A0ABR2Z9V1_9AGAR
MIYEQPEAQGDPLPLIDRAGLEETLGPWQFEEEGMGRSIFYEQDLIKPIRGVVVCQGHVGYHQHCVVGCEGIILVIRFESGEEQEEEEEENHIEVEEEDVNMEDDGKEEAEKTEEEKKKETDRRKEERKKETKRKREEKKREAENKKAGKEKAAEEKAAKEKATKEKATKGKGKGKAQSKGKEKATKPAKRKGVKKGRMEQKAKPGQTILSSDEDDEGNILESTRIDWDINWETFRNEHGFIAIKGPHGSNLYEFPDATGDEIFFYNFDDEEGHRKVDPLTMHCMVGDEKFTGSLQFMCREVPIWYAADKGNRYEWWMLGDQMVVRQGAWGSIAVRLVERKQKEIEFVIKEEADSENERGAFEAMNTDHDRPLDVPEPDLGEGMNIDNGAQPGPSSNAGEGSMQVDTDEPNPDSSADRHVSVQDMSDENRITSATCLQLVLPISWETRHPRPKIEIRRL